MIATCDMHVCALDRARSGVTITPAAARLLRGALVQIYAIRWHTAMTLALFLALLTAGVNLHGAESLN